MKSATSPIELFPGQQNARPLRRMFVRDLELECRIGIYEHEKAHAQRVRINLDTRVFDGKAPDHIDQVVSYEDFVRGAEAICRSGHIHLVETLAEKLADMCLTDKRVHSVTVRVEKLNAFANAVVGVEIDRFSPHG